MFYMCLHIGEKKRLFTKINIQSQFIQILGVCVKVLLCDVLEVLKLEVILTFNKENNY